jgi:hypothetical protein
MEKIVADNLDVLVRAPAAFIAALGLGVIAGWVAVGLIYNQRLTHYQELIDNYRDVLDEKLPVRALRPFPPKRSKQMSFGLILIFGGVGLALLGALIVALDRSGQPGKLSAAPGPIAPSVIAPVVQNPSPPSSSPPASNPPTRTLARDEDAERQQLLKSRGEMELAVRDADGTPLKHLFNTQSMEMIKVSDGTTSYEISTHIANSTAVWLNMGPHGGSAKKLYVSKSAQPSRPIDIRQLRPSKGSDTISIGQRAFLELENEKILQLLLVGVLWYRAGDDVDEARFKYKIYDAGVFLIDPL